jgi:predicted dehydrogenase
MKIAIVGCGLIGTKRARCLGSHELVCAVDTDSGRAENLCRMRGQGTASAAWQAAVDSDAELVVVATTNNYLAPVACAALKNGKHVLVEKPAARSVAELDTLLAAAQSGGSRVCVGYNHRFHPAFSKAREIVDSGALGPLLFLRVRYGHGGRIGYDKEWRADPAVAGGGELLDQGSHVIDLSRWFLGDFPHVEGFAATYFWDMPVEDNAFVLLRTAQQQAAWFHVSCTEWKNMFCFELYGKNGKLQIDGLGGSYGPEKLTYYRMLPQMGPPETTAWDFSGEDASWEHEMEAFVQEINGGPRRCACLEDARAVLQIIETLHANQRRTAS